MFSIGYFLKINMVLPKKHWGQIILASLFNNSLWHIFSAWGINLLGSGQASIIAYTMPLWAVTLSILLRQERPDCQRLIGLGIGISGIMTLLVGKFGIFSLSPSGTIMMLLAAIFWGIGTVIHKSINWEMPPIAVASWQLLIGGLPITIIAMILEVQLWAHIFDTLSLKAVFSTIFILAYPIIFCWFAWFRIVSETSVTVSTVAIMLVPVIGVFSSQLLLGEILGIKEIVSLFLVCCSLAFVLLPKYKMGSDG